MAETPDSALLRALAEASEDGLVWLRDGRVAWANPAFARLAEVGESKDLVGLGLEELFADAGAGIPCARVPERVRCRMGRAGGGRIVEVEPIAIGAGAGTEVGIAVATGHATGPGTARGLRVRDLTERETLEAEVLRSGRALHEANRELAALRERVRREHAEREELLTVVSHELRTPCTVIAGYNRMLLSEQFGPLGGKQRHFLEESQKSCQRLNGFIANLLETARHGLVVGPLEVAEAPLAPLIEAVSRQLAPLLEDHALRLELRLDGSAPRARFDPPRIEQVLVNLLGNAIKFAPDGSALELTLAAADGGAAVEVAVLDRGPGVAPADRERIFEPYVQAGESRKAGGLGLGLAICRRIVEAHGGTIRVEAREGGGSRFAFRLPAAPRGAEREGRERR